jgi:hypothetical protein
MLGYKLQYPNSVQQCSAPMGIDDAAVLHYKSWRSTSRCGDLGVLDRLGAISKLCVSHLLHRRSGTKPRMVSTIWTLLILHACANIVASHMQAQRADGHSLRWHMRPILPHNPDLTPISALFCSRLGSFPDNPSEYLAEKSSR